MDQPTAEDALRRLEPLVGDWTFDATWPDGRPWPGTGRMSVRWHESQAHLVQRVSHDLPEAPSTLSVIGCDGANGTYTQLYTDDRGVCRLYAMTIDAGVWTLTRSGEPFAQRFTGTFGDDGTSITGRWEAAADGIHFETDFELVHRRLSLG
jgi:hypothetical protein